MQKSREQLIREVQKLEQELQLANKKNGLIQEYLSGLSHDIRTPMNAILGFSGLICELEEASEELQLYSRMISRSSKKLLETISNLIDYARIETGHIHLTYEGVHIAELFDDLRAELEEDQLLYGKQAIQTHFRPQYNGSGVVFADRNRLYQILKIFLDNSLKFTRKGEIILSSRMAEEGVCVFEVSDTGSGMDPETLSRLFTLFSDQPRGIPGKVKSRGLGMLVAHRLSHLMHGELTVQSVPSKGTTIRLMLPQNTV